MEIASLKEWLGSGSINIFGRPFAGKDTQGRLLAEAFNGSLLGGGDILRGSDIPDEVREIMKTGQLIPTADYISIVLPFLSHQDHNEKPLILSSVGRWHGEEAGVLKATEQSGHETKAVIYVNLSEEQVRERWQNLHSMNDRGDRHDDTAKILEIRLKEYREKTLPVIEFYREKGLLIEVDGWHSPEEVYKEIIDALASRAASN